jgi:hypothetical protein
MMGSLGLFGHARRGEKPASEVPDLPEIWRYWQYTKDTVENHDRSRDRNPGPPPEAKNQKKEAA